MVRRSQQAGARVLLLGMKVPPNYGRAYSEAFERVFSEVARETGAALVHFFLEGLADRLEFFQTDRIHPNEAAQPRMLDNVWPALERLL
jgi:acyl-CoA thioesterase-1